LSEHKNLNNKRFYAYVLGFALSVVILSLFAQVIVWLGMLLHKNFYLLTVSTIAGTFVGLLGISRLVSRYFMTTPHPISI
jgi:heme/copper-type cytochrome/quinol oxidase subunit 4